MHFKKILTILIIALFAGNVYAADYNDSFLGGIFSVVSNFVGGIHEAIFKEPIKEPLPLQPVQVSTSIVHDFEPTTTVIAGSAASIPKDSEELFKLINKINSQINLSKEDLVFLEKHFGQTFHWHVNVHFEDGTIEGVHIQKYFNEVFLSTGPLSKQKVSRHDVVSSVKWEAVKKIRADGLISHGEIFNAILSGDFNIPFFELPRVWNLQNLPSVREGANFNVS